MRPLRHFAFPFYPRYQPFFNAYYVLYPDGEESGLMDKRTAKEYAGIFGGSVVKATRVYGKLFGFFPIVKGWV